MTLLFVLTACLPTADDPVDVTVIVPAPPAPAREVTQTAARTAHLSVKSPQLAAVARGTAPQGVRVEGARVTVEMTWTPLEVAGTKGHALPAPFGPAVVPVDIMLDGTACDLGNQAPCRIVEGRLWHAGAAPRILVFAVDPALAAREADVRGAQAWFGGLSAAAYTTRAASGPVVALQSGAVRATLEAAPEGAALAFVARRLPSVLWVDVAPPVAIAVRQADAAGDRVLWTGDVAAGTDTPARIALDAAARTPWTQYVFSAAATPAQALGSVVVLTGARLETPR